MSNYFNTKQHEDLKQLIGQLIAANPGKEFRTMHGWLDVLLNCIDGSVRDQDGNILNATPLVYDSVTKTFSTTVTIPTNDCGQPKCYCWLFHEISTWGTSGGRPNHTPTGRPPSSPIPIDMGDRVILEVEDFKREYIDEQQIFDESVPVKPTQELKVTVSYITAPDKDKDWGVVRIYYFGVKLKPAAT